MLQAFKVVWPFLETMANSSWLGKIQLEDGQWFCQNQFSWNWFRKKIYIYFLNASSQVFCQCLGLSHWVKSVQIRSFFWSLFSRIQTEYGEILCFWTLFTQWFLPVIMKSCLTLSYWSATFNLFNIIRKLYRLVVYFYDTKSEKSI